MRLALLVAAVGVAGVGLASARAAPDERLLSCAGHTRAIADPAGDVRVQADEKVRPTSRTRALVSATDLRRAAVVLSRRTSCATLAFVRRPIAGRLSLGIWLLGADGKPLSVDAVYADFGAHGVRAGRVKASWRTLDPTNVRLSTSGSTVSLRFRLSPRLLTHGELRLAQLVWRVAMMSTLDGKPFAAMDTAPSDRNRKPRGVRQSDGRLVALP